LSPVLASVPFDVDLVGQLHVVLLLDGVRDLLPCADRHVRPVVGPVVGQAVAAVAVGDDLPGRPGREVSVADGDGVDVVVEALGLGAVPGGEPDAAQLAHDLGDGEALAGQVPGADVEDAAVVVGVGGGGGTVAGPVGALHDRERLAEALFGGAQHVQRSPVEDQRAAGGVAADQDPPDRRGRRHPGVSGRARQVAADRLRAGVQALLGQLLAQPDDPVLQLGADLVRAVPRPPGPRLERGLALDVEPIDQVCTQYLDTR
jgi:hypothetical protein